MIIVWLLPHIRQFIKTKPNQGVHVQAIHLYLFRLKGVAVVCVNHKTTFINVRLGLAESYHRYRGECMLDAGNLTHVHSLIVWSEI